MPTAVFNAPTLATRSYNFFLPLKRIYSTKVNKYTACSITSINKEYFLKIYSKI
jgi:hypothetical protein